MWRPINLTIENLGSYKKAELQFLLGKPNLIQGINRTDSEQESNGSGKSTLLEAISYLLIGGFQKGGVRDVDLIRDGEEEARLVMNLKNTRNKNLLRVVRVLSRKKSSTIEIFINDIPQNFASVNDGNNLLLKLIGIGKSDLQNYYLISRDKYISFYKSSDNDKKSVISRFSNASIIEPVDSILEDEIEEYEVKISNITIELTTLQNKILFYEEEKQRVSLEQVEQHRKAGEELQNKILSIQQKNTALQKAITDTEESTTFLQNEILTEKQVLKGIEEKISSFKGFDPTKEKELLTLKINEYSEKNRLKNEEIEKVQMCIKDLDKDLVEAKGLKSHLEGFLAGTITCPECSHQFVLGGDMKVDEARLILADTDILIQELQETKDLLLEEIQEKKTSVTSNDKEVTIIRTSIRELDNKHLQSQTELTRLRNSYSTQEQTVFTKEGKLNQTASTIKNYQSQIESNNSLIVSLTKQKQDLQEVGLASLIEPLDLKIEENKKLIIETQAKVEPLELEKGKRIEWLQHFKRFRTHLTNKAIKSIEGYTNLFLQKMGTVIQVEIEGYKVLSDLSVREKITPNILKNGQPFGSFYKCSAGERGRVELATILTQQQLINMSSPSGGLDLLFIDEILDSVDGRGFQSMTRSLIGLEKCINLITHINIPSHEHYQVLTAEKNNGVTTLRYE